MATSASFEIDSYIKGYHVYKDIWTPELHENLKTVPEPTNLVDKYAVCVLRHETIVGHLKLGDNGRFAKTIFYYLRADTRNSCSVVVKGKAVNLGDGDGMQVPCTLSFVGKVKFIEVLQKQLLSVQNDYQKKQC